MLTGLIGTSDKSSVGFQRAGERFRFVNSQYKIKASVLSAFLTIEAHTAFLTALVVKEAASNLAPKFTVISGSGTLTSAHISVYRDSTNLYVKINNAGAKNDIASLITNPSFSIEEWDGVTDGLTKIY